MIEPWVPAEETQAPLEAWDCIGKSILTYQSNRSSMVARYRTQGETQHEEHPQTPYDPVTRIESIPENHECEHRQNVRN